MRNNSNDYPNLRVWLARRGAQCAGTIGTVTDGDQGADFEAWLYGEYSFILARKRVRGVTTGGVTLYARIGDKDSPVEDDIAYLRRVFREADVRRDIQRHKNETENACAMPQDEHTCNRITPHDGAHTCACGETWTQGEGDNAVLVPGKPKKKVERVRGFQI